VTPEDSGRLAELKATLERHKGRRPLYLLVTGEDGCTRRVRAPSDMRVDISAELATDVDRLLGRGRVRLARL
jgi:hypothetical protein